MKAYQPDYWPTRKLGAATIAMMAVSALMEVLEAETAAAVEDGFGAIRTDPDRAEDPGRSGRDGDGPREGMAAPTAREARPPGARGRHGDGRSSTIHRGLDAPDIPRADARDPQLRSPAGSLDDSFDDRDPKPRIPTGRPLRYTEARDRALAARSVWQTDRAGLVLFHPYLPVLFDRLGVAAETRARTGGRPVPSIVQDHLPRAHAALAALAARPTPEAPDLRPLCALEKTLLGLDPGAPSPSEAALSDAEIEMIEALLRAVVVNWTKLGQTSPDGLRATFVRRDGLLRRGDAGPVLTVAPGPFDVLLDGLPWPLSLIRLPWMEKPLTVRWRSSDD